MRSGDVLDGYDVYRKLARAFDLQELYRYLLDDLVIRYCQKLNKKDLVLKQETVSSNRKAKREYLSDSLAKSWPSR